MKILAVDTSSKICSVCILEDTKVLMEKHNDDEKTHSQKLMPLIDDMFKEAKLSLDDIDLLACCQGPGSFTGIRIGISTVKAFADVKNIPTIGITSLESLVYNIKENGYIASIIDAKNNNVYFSLYELNENRYIQKYDFIADNINNVIEIIKNMNLDNIMFVGDGSVVHKDLLLNSFFNSKFANENENIQTSISVGIAAYNKYNSNGNMGENLQPLYLKKSQAERILDGEK